MVCSNSVTFLYHSLINWCFSHLYLIVVKWRGRLLFRDLVIILRHFHTRIVRGAECGIQVTASLAQHENIEFAVGFFVCLFFFIPLWSSKPWHICWTNYKMNCDHITRTNERDGFWLSSWTYFCPKREPQQMADKLAIWLVFEGNLDGSDPVSWPGHIYATNMGPGAVAECCSHGFPFSAKERLRSGKAEMRNGLEEQTRREA